MLPSFVARIRPAVGRVASSAPIRVAGMVRASASMTTAMRARPSFVVPFRRTFAAAAPADPLPAASPAQPDTGVQQTMPAESDDKTLKITRKFTHSVVSEPSIKTGGDYTLPHPIWKKDYLENVQITHLPPKSTLDTVALWTIRIMRFNFDLMSGYFFMKKTETLWLNRIIFLETVAGVPGSIGATLRHLHSLRKLQRDHGWIHTLLEEAENERMHLLTAITLRQPGPLFRAAIFLTQGIFFNFYWIAYLLSPKFCHRIVGYLEEQAVVTYTDLLAAIDRKEVWDNTPAPDVAKFYWRLGENSTMRDVIANIRADESHHRDVNHQFADLPTNKTNPFAPGH